MNVKGEMVKNASYMYEINSSPGTFRHLIR